MVKIEIYADGSGTIAARPIGYGWVMVIDGVTHSEGNGHKKSGTNNDAEMEAAIAGLTAVLKYCMNIYPDFKAKPEAQNLPIDLQVTLCSDSQITLGWANGTYKFKQEAKYARFEILKELVKRLAAQTKWVRGHSGQEQNERCDELANLGRLGMSSNDRLPSQKDKRKAKIKKSQADGSIGLKKKGTIALWYKNSLKVIDLDDNVVEDHDESKHGKRDSYLEVK